MLLAEDFRRSAREALKGKWGLAVGTGFVAALLGAGGGFNYSSRYNYKDSEYLKDFFQTDTGETILHILIPLGVILIIYAVALFFIGGAITLGYVRFNKNLINNTNPEFKDIFSRFDIFWEGFLLQLLTGIFIALWTFLFIIPGIIAAYRYAMAPYILEDNPTLGITDAITASKNMMMGNKWRLFCLELSFIGWGFLCIFTLGIGFLWLFPYMSASKAAFYYEVSGKSHEPPSEFEITE